MIAFERVVETEAKFVEPLPANVEMALFKSLSAAWKALTISASELSATASTLLRTLSTRVLTAAKSEANAPETDTIVDCKADSAPVARVTSAARSEAI